MGPLAILTPFETLRLCWGEDSAQMDLLPMANRCRFLTGRRIAARCSFSVPLSTQLSDGRTLKTQLLMQSDELTTYYRRNVITMVSSHSLKFEPETFASQVEL